MKTKPSFKELHSRHKQAIVKYLRKLYVAGYNIYGFYWLYTIIWVLPFDLENLLLWFFAMTAQFFFVLDSRDKLDMTDYFKEVK